VTWRKDAYILGLNLGLFGAVVAGVSVKQAPIPVLCLCTGWGAERLASEVFADGDLSGQTVPRSSGMIAPSGRVKWLIMAVLATMECWLCLRVGAILFESGGFSCLVSGWVGRGTSGCSCPKRGIALLLDAGGQTLAAGRLVRKDRSPWRELPSYPWRLVQSRKEWGGSISRCGQLLILS